MGQSVLGASRSRKMATTRGSEDEVVEEQESLHIDGTRGHIRSLSAPEKASKASSSSWDFSPRGALNQALKESIQSWRWRMKFKNPDDRKKRILNNRRAALENDVAQLQTQLEDEKALRQGLERALGGADAISPPPVTLPNLAPQAQKLITEITCLEKEVTHLEQHVLNLYRKVLDQRLPGLQSEPASPCSHVERKRAMAGESRFKSDPLLPPQVHKTKRPHSAISTRHSSLLGGTVYSIHEEEPRETRDFSGELPSVCVRATPPRRSLSAYTPGKSYAPFQVERVPERVAESESAASEGSSEVSVQQVPGTPDPEPEASARYPNKLSEELVRCMAAIYCKLADPPLAQLQSTTLQPLSPSSSNSTNSGSSASMTTVSSSSPHESSWSPRWRTENYSHSCELLSGERDQLQQLFPNAACSCSKELSEFRSGPYTAMVEVPWICVDKDRLTYAARALRNFRTMVEQLEQVDPGKMNHEQKLAFWINIYNALMMHAYLAYGIPRSRLKRLSLLQKAAYKVGAHSINAQTIEHNILGCRSIRPSHWFQALLSQGTKFKSSDERRSYALHVPEPLVCFALCCGGRSDPAIRVYSARNVRSELELAKLDFLQASVRIRGESKVLLPRILEWYARELAINPSALLELVSQNVPAQVQAGIRRCIQLKPHKSPAHCLEWIPYSFGFGYIFVQELVHRFPPSAQ